MFNFKVSKEWGSGKDFFLDVVDGVKRKEVVCRARELTFFLNRHGDEPPQAYFREPNIFIRCDIHKGLEGKQILFTPKGSDSHRHAEFFSMLCAYEIGKVSYSNSSMGNMLVISLKRSSVDLMCTDFEVIDRSFLKDQLKAKKKSVLKL